MRSRLSPAAAHCSTVHSRNKRKSRQEQSANREGLTEFPAANAQAASRRMQRQTVLISHVEYRAVLEAPT